MNEGGAPPLVDMERTRELSNLTATPLPPFCDEDPIVEIRKLIRNNQFTETKVNTFQMTRKADPEI